VLGFLGGIEFGVVFEDNISTEFAGKVGKDCAKDVGVLLDDAREWDDERRGGAACFLWRGAGRKEVTRGFCRPPVGDGEGKETVGLMRGMGTILADSGASLIDGISSRRTKFFGGVGFERAEHTLENVVGPRLAVFGFSRRHEGLGGEEVCIDQSGKEEASHESHAVVASIGTFQWGQGNGGG